MVTFVRVFGVRFSVRGITSRPNYEALARSARCYLMGVRSRRRSKRGRENQNTLSQKFKPYKISLTHIKRESPPPAAEGRAHTRLPKRRNTPSPRLTCNDDRKAAELAVAPVQGHTHATLCHCGVAHMECTWTAYVCTARAAGTRTSTVIRW